MKTNKFGEQIYSEDDVCDLLMQGRDLSVFEGMIVDQGLDLSQWPDILESVPGLQQQRFHSITVPEWHQQNQRHWYMPEQYQQLDIAEHVLTLCRTDAELQRVAQELLLFQERDLFDLLRYLKYLVDVMRENHVIWGVGRGSSVASYVLYLLGVHRIDSMYYDLDPTEFLR